MRFADMSAPYLSESYKRQDRHSHPFRRRLSANRCRVRACRNDSAHDLLICQFTQPPTATSNLRNITIVDQTSLDIRQLIDQLLQLLSISLSETMSEAGATPRSSTVESRIPPPCCSPRITNKQRPTCRSPRSSKQHCLTANADRVNAVNRFGHESLAGHLFTPHPLILGPTRPRHL